MKPETPPLKKATALLVWRATVLVLEAAVPPGSWATVPPIKPTAPTMQAMALLEQSPAIAQQQQLQRKLLQQVQGPAG